MGNAVPRLPNRQTRSFVILELSSSYGSRMDLQRGTWRLSLGETLYDVGGVVHESTNPFSHCL